MEEWPIVICFFWRFAFVILLPVVMFSWFTTTHTAVKPHIAFLSVVQSDWKTLPLLEFQLINSGLDFSDNYCEEIQGYEEQRFGTWKGIRMGCNCTSTKIEEYFQGSCTYVETMKGCTQMTPRDSINIEVLEGKYLCVKRYKKHIY